MPIINHNQQPRIQSDEFASLRPLVTKDHGAASLTIQEITITPGMTGRLQTHPVDIAFMMHLGSRPAANDLPCRSAGDEGSRIKTSDT
jgi:hypothetical protein